jgi:serine protease
MKKILLPALLIILFNACQRNDDDVIPVVQNNGAVLQQKSILADVPSGQPMKHQEIDAEIEKQMNANKSFSWNDAGLKMLWSAMQYDDHVIAIGYKPAAVTDVEGSIHNINLKTGQWKAVHDALLDLIMKELNLHSKQKISLDEILVEDDAVLPILTLRLSDKHVITALYNLKNVRYLEPMSYWPAGDAYKVQSTSGCNASTTPLNAADFSTLPPGCRLPWNYNNLNIPAAWNTSQGEGIKIGIIDAGLSSSQSLLGSMFQNGYSNVARTVNVDYTYGASAYTTCTHGTSMSGLAVGPRNDQNAVTGVAYKSSLFFVRGCEDVVLDKSAEKTGLKNALIKLGDDADTRIISMSVGYPFASNVMKDGVTYAYNKGKMLFAAAGTSFSWTSWWGVVYPAAYSQCIAITGVKENGSTCASCHDGSQVKFTIPMERNASSSRNSISLPVSGATPTYIGGSSAATATAAGIAALVWSAKPTLTRDQVYNCMKNTAQFYPSLNSTKGYGNLNASAAVTMAVTL